MYSLPVLAGRAAFARPEAHAAGLTLISLIGLST